MELQSGEDPTSTNFGNQTLYPLSAAQFTAMAALTGLNVNYLAGRAATRHRRLLQPGGHEHDHRRRL